MNYQEINPGTSLRHYVKCYYFYESDSDVSFDDTVFPSGCPEIIFNLGGGTWSTEKSGVFDTHPQVEFWGQIIRPIRVRSTGKNVMFGIRFYPQTAAYFVDDKVEVFNNQVADYGNLSTEVHMLRERLLESASNRDRVSLVEEFLCEQLERSLQRHRRMTVVTSIMNEMGHRDFFDNIDNVASRHGITSRYLQKLFLQYTGLTPKLYNKINRFQQSLKRVSRRDASLTTIAYDCGYYDQSHFIREFKSFTGYTPSVFSEEQSSNSLIFSVG